MLAHGLEEYQTIGTRAEQVYALEKSLFDLYRNPELNYKPKELEQRGGAHYSDAACETIASIYANKNTELVVSTRNNGSVPDLPADCAVEVTSYIGAQGARTVAFGPLPTAERGWLQVMKAMELLTIEAAITGDYGTALQAFTINPLIPSGERAKRILDELLLAHKNYLPNFKESIERLENKGIQITDEKVRHMCQDN